MKKAIVLFAVLCMVGCAGTGQNAITGGGTGDGDIMMSAGKVIDGKAEVGITAVGFQGDQKMDYAVGPYAVYLIKDPLPEGVTDDWQPFAGGAMLLDDDLQAIPKIVAGVIYKPKDKLSPVYLAEKAFPTGSVDSANIAGRSDDLYHWVALRYRF